MSTTVFKTVRSEALARRVAHYLRCYYNDSSFDVAEQGHYWVVLTQAADAALVHEIRTRAAGYADACRENQ